MTRRQPHTHQYHATYPWGKNATTVMGKIRKVWACALPDCTHFLPTNMAEPHNKLSLCTACFKPYTMDHDALQMDEPLCEVCRNPDRIVLGDDFDVEYFQAKAKLAKTTGRALNDITEEEVRKYMRMDISR